MMSAFLSMLYCYISSFIVVVYHDSRGTTFIMEHLITFDNKLMSLTLQCVLFLESPFLEEKHRDKILPWC